jgi:hypothetical protein
MAKNMPATGSNQTHPQIATTAALILLGLMFPGMFALAAATDAVPSSDMWLAFAPAFYSLTVMAGHIAVLIGFGICGRVLRRSADPARGWARVTITLLVVLSLLFLLASFLGGPAFGMAIGAIALGCSIVLLWCAPRTRTAMRWHTALLGISIPMLAITAIQLAVEIQISVA